MPLGETNWIVNLSFHTETFLIDLCRALCFSFSSQAKLCVSCMYELVVKAATHRSLGLDDGVTVATAPLAGLAGHQRLRSAVVLHHLLQAGEGVGRVERESPKCCVCVVRPKHVLRADRQRKRLMVCSCNTHNTILQ